MGTPGIELAPSLNQARWPWILKDTRFTAVGYGSVRDTMIGGFQPIDFDNVLRNRAQQGFNSLTKAWLTLPMVNTRLREAGSGSQASAPMSSRRQPSHRLFP